MGNVDAIKLGPGLLYVAPIGTTEPTTLTGALAVEWVAIGYTESGTEQNHDLAISPVYVAEELWPVRHVVETAQLRVNFEAAELTAENLRRAWNGGTVTSPSGGYVKFTPPGTNAAMVRRMLVWQADDNEERWLFRRVFNASGFAVPRRRGNDKARIPMSFALEKPESAEPYDAWFADDLAA
jgi:hypothetical protein